jgi:hypothetical protein
VFVFGCSADFQKHALRIPDYFIQRWTPVSDWPFKNSWPADSRLFHPEMDSDVRFIYSKNVDLRIPDYFIQRWAPVSNWSVENTLVQIPVYFIQRWTPVSRRSFKNTLVQIPGYFTPRWTSVSSWAFKNPLGGFPIISSRDGLQFPTGLSKTRLMDSRLFHPEMDSGFQEHFQK